MYSPQLLMKLQSQQVLHTSVSTIHQLIRAVNNTQNINSMKEHKVILVTCTLKMETQQLQKKTSYRKNKYHHD
jgi:hypothetical protein